MQTRKLVGALVMVGTLVILAGCGTQTQAPVDVTVKVGTDWRFNPGSIDLKVNQPVKLTFVNQDRVMHDLVVTKVPLKGVKKQEEEGDHSHDYDLHVAAVGGAQGVIEFTPTKAGEYEVVCLEPGHKDSGMVGKLVVK